MKSTTSTTIAVAEMLSPDQSTANIAHWMTCLGQDFFNTFKQHLHPQKVETDFSWAIIQATLEAFCHCNIYEYLWKCLHVCEECQSCNFTVVHVCAAHMINIFF